MAFTIRGIHHIEFTVSNLQRSKEFYLKLPNFKIVAEYPNFIMFDAGSFKLGLTDHKLNLKTDLFSEMNVGLDHVAFTVSSIEDLNEAKQFFAAEKIEHSEIKELSNQTYIITFRDPDNIQLELAYRKL